MRFALAAIVAMTAAAPALAQDGQALFNAQCKSCHTVTGKSTPMGPTLKGVVGRKAASAADYKYSAGLAKKGGAWSDAALDAYLTAPAAYAPGTKMFNRVAQPQARAAIIGYLKTQK